MTSRRGRLRSVRNLSCSPASFRPAPSPGLFDATPPLHILLVSLEAVGEHMTASPVRDKVEVVGSGRRQSGCERRPTWICYRGRRQSVDVIGVVWRAGS